MDRDNAKILIVDDEMVNIRVLVATLDGYECIIAKSGEKALALAEGGAPPDLILLDVMMPDMDGYEVCRRLKQNPETHSIPIIFITAKGTVDEETMGLEMGAVDYIAKPFSPSIVKARVANHVQLKKQRDLLERLNLTDQLTGISNRRCFDDTLNYECLSAIRTQAPLSVIMLDIDFFKLVNDTAGHVFGDDCLKQIAKALAQATSRSTDLVARYGGEEFVVVLPATDFDGAILTADNMRSSVENLNISHPANEGWITISIGVSTATCTEDLKPEAMIKLADKKLYEAKEGGRNRVCG